MIDEQKLSPMMLQWLACKKSAGDALLLFRVGDFYEAFHDDAVTVARELDLTLTSRQEIPMSGVPYHASDAYIDKLVGKGFRVAIAEQLDDPAQTKGLVQREVVRIVTPGTLINSTLLSDKANNYFAAVSRVGAFFGLAVLDLTTSEFRVTEISEEQNLLNEIYRLRPSELLISPKLQKKHEPLWEAIKQSCSCLVTLYDDWHFEHQVAYDYLVSHLKVTHLDGFGLKGMVAGINASGAILHYLKEVLCLPIEQIEEIRPYSTSQFMTLDYATQRNLELTEPLQESSRKHTLLKLLDHTQTPMGARLLRIWIKQPLLSSSEIGQRQDAIESFFTNPMTTEQLGSLLGKVRDLERLMMRISSGYASARDLVALRFSLEPIQQIKSLLKTLPQTALIWQEEQKMDPLPAVSTKIAQALIDEPPLRLTEGGIFREGFHPELDELRQISRNSQTWLVDYQTKLREESAIKNLKVGFTRAFGYYIEVSKGNADKVPDTFQRRQTLTNAERFITPELKQFESKVYTAQERMIALETELFNVLRCEVAQYSKVIMRMAQAIACLDVLRSLAEVARREHYVRPIIDTSQILQIEEGRHPVVEACNRGERFIPNDTILNDSDSRLLILTGPNMAGKSTYIRQVALIVILAQMGSFIPAKAAHIGIVDKVFTRIGASDDLARGQSTFMVEMSETANILNNATARSLVILDEIGRGTSTYDGISIAWAVAEHLLITENRNPKTLFATHYWELTKMEGMIPGAVNYNVAVQESPENIVFLRKIIRGGTDKSYGIHVARLAGLPSSVLTRAKELLLHLEENANRKSLFQPSTPKKMPSKPKSEADKFQLTLF